MTTSILITTRSRSHPYSVSTSVATFDTREAANRAKVEIELSNSGTTYLHASVLILEGTA